MKLNAACSLKSIPSLAEMNKRVRISIGRVSRYKFINTKSRISSTPFLPLKIGLNLVHIAKKARALVTRKNCVLLDKVSTWKNVFFRETIWKILIGHSSYPDISDKMVAREETRGRNGLV